ncbi:MAG: hypothetical protein QM831_18640 [Kofleriaceae bacterium]
MLSSVAFAGGGENKPSPPPAAMEMPKPAQQIADRAKMMAGTWKCDGTSAGMDGKDMAFAGTFTAKTDLDGWWMHESFSGKAGTGKTAMNYKFEQFATYDGGMKKWRHVFVDNWGGQMIGTSDDMKDGKAETAFESNDMMGKSMVKDSVDASDMKKGVHMWGQMSKDSGKTWTKIYDMTCKK